MADSYIEITDPLSATVQYLRLKDNGDGTYSIATNTIASALPSGAATSAKQDTIISQLQTLNSLIPSVYDYISLSYTGSNLTGVVFKTGGSGGTTVSTLTLAYDSSNNLTSVTKS